MENIFNNQKWQWMVVIIILLAMAFLSGYLAGKWSQIGLYQSSLEKISDINACN